jgi:hypothetical protein
MTRSKYLTTFGLLLTLRLAAIGATGADLTTTAIVLHQGGHELNPLFKHHTMVVATATNTAVLVGLYKLEAKHPKLAAMFYVAMIGAHSAAAIHNGRLIR